MREFIVCLWYKLCNLKEKFVNNDPLTPTTPNSEPPAEPPSQPGMPVTPDTNGQPPAPVEVPQSAESANPFTAAASATGAGMVPNQGVAASEDPGKTMGVVGFVLSLLGLGVISLIVSIVATTKSKKAGFKNGFALAGIIISTISIIIGTFAIIFIVLAGKSAYEYCKENGTTVKNPDGTTSYHCGAESTTSAGNATPNTTQAQPSASEVEPTPAN